MSQPYLSFISSGLVTSVGYSAAASCAAIRAKVSNPTESRFCDSDGDWIVVHRVEMDGFGGIRAKLASMATAAVRDCLNNAEVIDYSETPMLLCLPERERPGLPEGLERDLFSEIEHSLGLSFAESSLVIPHGRISAALALRHARELIEQCSNVLIVATDSLLTRLTLRHYEASGRLLRPNNSDGFIAGEGAAALLLGAREGPVRLAGLGFAHEPAAIGSEKPLRGDGMASAIKSAIVDAGIGSEELDFRVTDLSGEQYYFKESSLAFSRAIRSHKEEFSLWHPAECIGETGATSGLVALVVATSAILHEYAPGPSALCQASNDNGARAAVIIRRSI